MTISVQIDLRSFYSQKSQFKKFAPCTEICLAIVGGGTTSVEYLVWNADAGDV